ncbi:ADP-ribose glycohydrolase MACROD1 isoform X4 [Denticeps clupeoides]|uniref:ADP-ribose glycohydrolase MACROD1 isoform X4 n=1 Tax=Denticeps clupeoides TaxID=299321 RepID=UPI0010A46389|nr:ADP-ribose glycohydrolase MACROD1 isoform X4 [Denticeps clupeoides]
MMAFKMSKLARRFQGSGRCAVFSLGAASPSAADPVCAAARRACNPVSTPGRWGVNVARRLGAVHGAASPRQRRLRFAATAAVVAASLHAGGLVAMSDRAVSLDSDAGDWQRAKKTLLTSSQQERRKMYRTDFLSLEQIPVWTHSGDLAGQPHYKDNDALSQKISLYRGDITKLEIDAIVNAANSSLLGGGGDVIHTVGPIAHGPVREKERKDLRDCYYNSLKTAVENQCRTVAFPCVSTGVYGYPPEQAVDVALSTVREYLDEHHAQLDRIIFCVFLKSDEELYKKNLPLYFPQKSPVKSKL